MLQVIHIKIFLRLNFLSNNFNCISCIFIMYLRKLLNFLNDGFKVDIQEIKGKKNLTVRLTPRINP